MKLNKEDLNLIQIEAALREKIVDMRTNGECDACDGSCDSYCYTVS